jgi:hypothetical protein
MKNKINQRDKKITPVNYTLWAAMLVLFLGLVGLAQFTKMQGFTITFTIPTLLIVMVEMVIGLGAFGIIIKEVRK